VARRHLLPVHLHTHALLVPGDHQGLFAHATDHVQRRLRFAVPCQLVGVGRHAFLDRFPHLLVDREEPVGGTEAAQGLVRAPVVVVLHPPRHPLPHLLDRLEARLGQELVLDRLPEAFDLPQRHRMMRRTAHVVDVVLLQFLLELRPATPDRVLRTVICQDFLRLAVLRHRRAVEIQHVGARRTAIDPQGDDVARKIIDEGDDVRHLALKREVRDVALPHLVRRRTLEPPRRPLAPVAALLPRRHHAGDRQFLPHRLRMRLEPEEPPQHLRDPPHAQSGIGALQRHDLLPHHRRRLWRAALAARRIHQPALTAFAVALRPGVYRRLRQSQFARHQTPVQPFVHMELYGLLPHRQWIRPRAMELGRVINSLRPARPAAPPRGRPSFLLFLNQMSLAFHR